MALLLLSTPPSAVYKEDLRQLRIKDHKIYLLERPQLGKNVIAEYVITTDDNYENFVVKFGNFINVQPVGKDTVFICSAVKGMPRTFRIPLRYFSTPASFSVIIPWYRYYQNPSLTLTRYLLNAKTGEFGSLKELQYRQPVEYRFNPHWKVFVEMVFDFEKDRWQKNRGIIDTLKTLTLNYPDSVCLVLYTDVFKADYPVDILQLKDKVKYLLSHGWQPLNDDARTGWLKKLNEDLANGIRKQEAADRRRQKLNDLKRLASWFLPVLILVVLAVYLLVINSRSRKRDVTPKIFDRLLIYIAYAIAIAVVLFFSWPYLGVKDLFKKTPIELRRQKEEEVLFLKSIYNKHILDAFMEFKKTGLNIGKIHQGCDAEFYYNVSKQSKYAITYQFAVEVCSTEGQWLYPPVSYDSTVIHMIDQFENNKRVGAILKKYRVKYAKLEKRGRYFHPGIIIIDTVMINGSRQPLLVKYDRSNDDISEYILPSNFDDSLFPEITRFKRLCNSAGMCLKEKSSIKFSVISGFEYNPALAGQVENGGEDILCVRFFSDRVDDFTYRWIPVPEQVDVPDSIIRQVLLRIANAGLPIEYVRDKIKLVRSYGEREPDYFLSRGDRVVFHAVFKWQTGIDWVDNASNGEGAYFEVIYEYFANSLKLGRCMGLPGRQVSLRPQWTSEGFYLRPIGKTISKKEAWDKLFDCLDNEGRFFDIYPELNFSEKPTTNGDLIYLRGRMGARVDLETGTAYKVNDPYGRTYTATGVQE